MCSIFSISLACVVNADIIAFVWVIQTHNMWCFIPHFDRFISALDIHTDAFVRIIPASIPLTEMYLFASLHIDWHIMYFLVRYTVDFTPIHGMFRLISMSQNADWFTSSKAWPCLDHPNPQAQPILKFDFTLRGSNQYCFFLFTFLRYKLIIVDYMRFHFQITMTSTCFFYV